MGGRRIILPVMLCAGMILSSCTQAPAPVVKYAQLQGAGSTGIHTVVRGDTVGNIAQRYRLDVRDILTVNGLQPPYKLSGGMRLKLPAPRTYRVREDDTLYSVARLFHTGPSQIVRLNGIAPPYALHQGMILKLPVLEDSPSSGVVPAMLRITAAPERIDREPLASAPPARGSPAALNQPMIPAPPRSGNGKFYLPVMGTVISPYGDKPGGLHNDGINIAAPKGAPVRAAENGVVAYAGHELKGYGNLILVRHAGGWMTAYAHLASFLVKKGAVVKRGQAIGVVGSTGGVDRPQLHFEIRHGADAVDPQTLM